MTACIRQLAQGLNTVYALRAWRPKCRLRPGRRSARQLPQRRSPPRAASQVLHDAQHVHAAETPPSTRRRSRFSPGARHRCDHGWSDARDCSAMAGDSVRSKQFPRRQPSRGGARARRRLRGRVSLVQDNLLGRIRLGWVAGRAVAGNFPPLSSIARPAAGAAFR